jgi:NAD(P)-dependent dehydrogenase (short-subunit alcohol dehydrogenase family)
MWKWKVENGQETLKMGRLEGRIAIVTGAAQGIGAALARGLAAEGASIAIADLDSGAQVVDEIQAAGGKAIDIPTDVTDEEACHGMVRSTVGAFGKLDILVNNAAVFSSVERKPFTDITVREWDQVLAVNTKGVWLCCKAAVPEMRKKGYGKIISLATGRIFKGAPFFLHYDASKAAVVGMTRSLAREVGEEHICVNAIAPGSTMSENILKRTNWKGGGPEKTRAARALKRDEVPEDLIGACIFFASAESDFITGQTLVVDGGSAMH